jgi:Xaa-Pro aminopeptidase
LSRSKLAVPVFDPAPFQRRRQRVAEALETDAMVLPAAPVLYRTGDSELRYRPDSELYYLSGFTEPEAVLVLRPFADEDRSVLFLRPRDSKAELWTGPRMGLEAAPALLGVDRAFPVDEVGSRLPELLAGARRVHFRLGGVPAVQSAVISALRHARARGARLGTGPREVVDPGEILDEMRLRKGPGEIEALREAARVTVLGFRAALAVTRPGAGEWEVEAALEATFRTEGASAPSFATIVGGGPNACILHYVNNDARLNEGDLVLVDAGAEVGMYSGDVTRTWPVSGRFTPEQRAICELVDAARAMAISAIRPGATTEGVHRVALGVLTGGLVDLGILSGDVDELIEQGAPGRYFPHRTSHWLGLDTHDPGDYRRDGAERPLEPGMVLTVEPGLYFGSPVGSGADDEAADDEPAVVRHFRGIGVRIEDDVLVTEDGAEVLTCDLPTDPDGVAALVGGG